MKDPSLIADLYFCGGLEHPERLNDILKYGFKESGQYSSSHTCIMYHPKEQVKVTRIRSGSQINGNGHKHWVMVTNGRWRFMYVRYFLAKDTIRIRSGSQTAGQGKIQVLVTRSKIGNRNQVRVTKGNLRSTYVLVFQTKVTCKKKPKTTQILCVKTTFISIYISHNVITTLTIDT